MEGRTETRVRSTWASVGAVSEQDRRHEGILMSAVSGFDSGYTYEGKNRTSKQRHREHLLKQERAILLASSSNQQPRRHLPDPTTLDLS